MEDSDVQQQIKKRARRRLVGAVFFASLVAVVLPMVMDNEPRQAVQDVEIRIPGQDEKPFAPKFAAAPVDVPSPPESAPPVRPAAPMPAAAPAAPVAPSVAPPVAPTARVIESSREQGQEKPAVKPEKPAEKAPEKAPEKPPAKPADKAAEKKPAEKAAEKSVEKKDKSAEDAKRAAAILAGGAEAKPAAKGGEHLILIGAFANEANVKTIKTKLGELGIKTFSETLDTPQGKKTRVRAGPFPNREAADKALEKMQRIGVSGVVAAKP